MRCSMGIYRWEEPSTARVLLQRPVGMGSYGVTSFEAVGCTGAKRLECGASSIMAADGVVDENQTLSDAVVARVPTRSEGCGTGASSGRVACRWGRPEEEGWRS